MYVAYGKVSFEVEEESLRADWLKDAGTLCRKLSQRQKLLARAFEDSEGRMALVLCMLGQVENSMANVFDKVIVECESYGLGRALDDERWSEFIG